MKVLVLKEEDADEPRVAATPDSVKKLKALGLDVVVEAGAGDRTAFADAEYETAGATISADTSSDLGDADAVLCVRRPSAQRCEAMRSGAVLVGMLEPYGEREAIEKWAAHGIEAFAMELMPRISRAQSMDVLSSQSNLAGYKAVLDAAASSTRDADDDDGGGHDRAGPGVRARRGRRGSAGDRHGQRLGAIVSATDVRPAVKEQVESLGGTFVMVESDETERRRRPAAMPRR